MTTAFRKGAAYVALFTGMGLISGPALAQYASGGKSQDNRMSGDMSYMQPQHERTASSTTTQTRTTQIQQPARAQPQAVEPAAGYDDTRFADFTGFYVGGDVGYGMGNADISGAPVGGDVGLDGWNGGLFGGYGYDTGNTWLGWLGGYIGLEGGYTWNDMDGNIGASSYSKGDSWHATLRPGLVLNEDALGYGIIGYSRAEFETPTGDDDLDGLILGAGAEFNTKTAMKTRLEYQYTTYEDANIGGTSIDPHDNVIKLGLVFRL